MIADGRDLASYLGRVSAGDRPPISLDVAALAETAWRLIRDASAGRMPIPAACTGPDGQMFFSWDRGRYHLEVEITPAGTAEYFYRDRESGRYRGEDRQSGDRLPDWVAGVLGEFG